MNKKRIFITDQDLENLKGIIIDRKVGIAEGCELAGFSYANFQRLVPKTKRDAILKLTGRNYKSLNKSEPKTISETLSQAHVKKVADQVSNDVKKILETSDFQLSQKPMTISSRVMGFVTRVLSVKDGTDFKLDLEEGIENLLDKGFVRREQAGAIKILVKTLHETINSLP